MAITTADISRLRGKTGVGMMDCKKALDEAGGDFEKAIDLLRQKGKKLFSNRAGRITQEGMLFTEVNEAYNEAALLMLSCETDFVAKNELFQALGKTIIKEAFKCHAKTVDDLSHILINGHSMQDAITSLMGSVGEKINISAYEMLIDEVVVPYIHTGNTLGVLVALKGAYGPEAINAGTNVAMHIAAMHPLAIDRNSIPTEMIEKEFVIAKEQILHEGHPQEMLEQKAQKKICKFFQENTLLEQPFIKETKITVAQYLQDVAPGLTVSSFKYVNVSG